MPNPVLHLDCWDPLTTLGKALTKSKESPFRQNLAGELATRVRNCFTLLGHAKWGTGAESIGTMSVCLRGTLELTRNSKAPAARLSRSPRPN